MHKFLMIAAIACAGALSISCSAQQTHSAPLQSEPVNLAIIPKPHYVAMQPELGDYELSSPVVIHADKCGKETAELLAEWIRSGTGFDVTVVPAPKQPDGSLTGIYLTSNGANPDLAPEGYELRVRGMQGITVTAPTEEGLFYGAQTIRQMLPVSPAATNVSYSFPAMEITDAPRFPWRGFMLDSSRHFQTKEFVMDVIDKLALYKMNRLHWHMIDANGWRLQIDSYPLLTEIGAFRNPDDPGADGFYSKDDVREVLAYAKKRHVMVIPEVELPAHNMAAIHAYPWLSCTGVQPKAGDGKLNHFTQHGYQPLCPGKETTFDFVETVLDEVTELFPSPYIHVGGDERPKGHWDKCALCQQRMKDIGLADEHDLQDWFMRRVSDYLDTLDRRAISWAITRSDPYAPTDMDDLGNNALIQNWHAGATFAARQGWDVVNSANGYYYFDYPEFPGMDKPSWMPLLNLEKVYSVDPVPPELEGQYAHHILGPEACLWTELLTQDMVYPAIFPRILAVAESGWSSEKKDWPEFEARVDVQEPRLNHLGVKFGTPPPAK